MKIGEKALERKDTLVAMIVEIIIIIMVDGDVMDCSDRAL
jgi:hypothetical protein